MDGPDRAGVPAPRTAYARVTLNREYLGVYVVNESSPLPPDFACRPLSGVLVGCRMVEPDDGG